MAQLVIHRGEIEVHLARKFWLEGLHLQVNNNEATEAQMVQKQVQGEFLAGNFEPELASDKGESHSKLDEEFLDVIEQTLFQFALARRGVKGEEIEDVRVFQDLFGEIGLWGRERRL